MGKVVGDITMSLDGFVTGPDPGLEHGLGRGGDVLHTWVTEGDHVDRQIYAEAAGATGVLIMGRRLFDIIDGPHGWTDDTGYGNGHEAPPPMLVVTRRPPDTTRLRDRVTYVVDGLGSAVSKGRAMAEERDVVVMGGAATVRGALDLGLLDELRLHLAPVVLGAGTPLFADGPPRTLRQVHVRPSAHAAHLTYRVD